MDKLGRSSEADDPCWDSPPTAGSHRWGRNPSSPQPQQHVPSSLPSRNSTPTSSNHNFHTDSSRVPPPPICKLAMLHTSIGSFRIRNSVAPASIVNKQTNISATKPTLIDSPILTIQVAPIVPRMQSLTASVRHPTRRKTESPCNKSLLIHRFSDTHQYMKP